ncbi:MAG: hypothetical protein ACREM3_28395 [Candidatus Rokuibacteriota bacterium]
MEANDHLADRTITTTSLNLKPPRKLGRRLNRAANPGSTAPKFPWRTTPEGLAAKFVVYFWALDRVGGDETVLAHTGNWAGLGITAAGALQVVTAYLPWFGAFYEETMGKPLTGERLRDRLFNMYYSRPAGTMGPSGEHPSHSPSMGPFCGIAEALFAARRPLSREVVRELFCAKSAEVEVGSQPSPTPPAPPAPAVVGTPVPPRGPVLQPRRATPRNWRRVLRDGAATTTTAAAAQAEVVRRDDFAGARRIAARE